MTKSHLLKISVSVNVFLIGIVALKVARREQPVAPPQDEVFRAASVPVPMADTHAEPVREVESPQLLKYIADLRATDVSTTSARNLVNAKVAENFAAKRRLIESRPAPTEETRRERAQLLDQLSNEQQSLVDRLLQEAPAPQPAALYSDIPVNAGPSAASTAAQKFGGDAPASVGPQRKPSAADAIKAAGPAQLPAAMLDVNPEVPLTETQARDIDRLQDDFVRDVGETNNPSDPAYRQRWQTAQDAADAKFRAKFGTEAFLKFNAEAGRRSADR